MTFDMFRGRGSRSRLDPRVDPFSLPQELLKPEHLMMLDAYGSTTLGTTGFGPAYARFITSGVFNADFYSLPADPSIDINASSNVMPYWPLTKASGTAVTGRNVADTDAGSGRVLRLSIASGAAGDNSYVEQIIPVNGSQGRLYVYEATLAVKSLVTGLPEVYLEVVYLKTDLTTVGSTVTNFRTLTQINSGNPALGNILQFGAGVTLGPVPGNAQYLRVRVGMRRGAAANGTTGSADIQEVLLDRWSTNGTFFPDAIDPAKSAGGIQQQDGVLGIGIGGDRMIALSSVTTNLTLEPAGDVNLTPGGDVGLFPTGGVNIQSGGDVFVAPDLDVNLQPVGNLNLDPDGDLLFQNRPEWLPARLEGFTIDNPAASAGPVTMGRFVTTQTSSFIARPIAGRAGRVVGLAWRKSAVLTAGQIDLAVVVGGSGTIVVSLTSASGNSGIALLGSPIGFSASTSLGVDYQTDAGYLPVTLDYAVDILVEYEALP